MGIAIGLLVMMYPIMCKVRFETLHLVFKKPEIWRQIAFSIVVNWIVAPLLMVRTTPPICRPSLTLAVGSGMGIPPRSRISP